MESAAHIISIEQAKISRAMIAKIPFPLAQHIAQSFKPHVLEVVA